MPLRIARLVAVLSVLVGCLLSAGGSVAAQVDNATPAVSPSPPQFGIYPIGDFDNRYFELEIEAGASMRLTAGIVNSGMEPVALHTFATNAFNPPNGGFAAGTEEDEPTGPTRWLEYPNETFELAPGEIREIEFTVTVPVDTPPGQYVTALVVRTEDAVAIPGSEMFQQVIRGAMSVEITVPGPMSPGFALGTPEFAADSAVRSLNVPITNTGNVLVKPAGTLSITTPDGEEVLTSHVEMGSVYGGSATTIQISLPEQFRPGTYFVSVALTDEATGATASVTDVPVMLAEADVADAPTFTVDAVSITANTDPIQFANVSVTITNSGQVISTASVTLNVERDGEEVERYPLAQNQALPQGSTEITQRYIPIDGWQEGTYSFQLVIAAVNDGTTTVLATIDVEAEIIVP